MSKLKKFFNVNFKAVDQETGEKYVLLADCLTLKKAETIEQFIRKEIKEKGNDAFLYDLEIRDRLGNLVGGFGPIFHVEVSL